MVIAGDNGSDIGSEALQQPISAPRTQSKKKREKNRRRNERNKANPLYQAIKKERDRKRRNAKKHKRDQANPEYKARKNAKKHERDKAKREYVTRKNAKKHERDKANQDYVARKNAKKHERDKAKAEYQERKRARHNRKKNAKKHVLRATYSNKVVEYERILKNGHDRVCVCCGQLFAEIGIVVNAQQCILAIEKDPQLIVVRHIDWIPELQLCITLEKGKCRSSAWPTDLTFHRFLMNLKDYRNWSIVWFQLAYPLCR